MPYFKNNDINILFIHIPKTGGTSLEDYFSSKYNIPLNKDSLFLYLNKEKRNKLQVSINSSLQHMTYQTIFKYKKEFNVNFDDLQVITIVRNPYDRIVSDLFYFKLINKNTSKEEVFNIIKDYIKRTDLDNHNIPQYLFITDGKHETIPNIKILNTETLTSDMHKLGYTDFDLHSNANSTKIDYYKYLNDDSINLINDFYDLDFRLFNYTKINQENKKKPDFKTQKTEERFTPKNLPDVDVKEALNEYFKLKNKYETQLATHKKKIINKNFLSKKEKKIEYNKIKPKCILCKRPGGTLFTTTYIPDTDKTESYRELKAVCGIVADPCNLNIRIHLAKQEILTEVLENIQKEIKEATSEIIQNKNKLLFGYAKTEEVLSTFENVKEYIENLTTIYQDYLLKHNEIVDNREMITELREATTNSYIEIQRIKQCIDRMNDTGNLYYATEAVEIYNNSLTPLLKKIQRLKYNETFVWFNEYTNDYNLIQNKYSIDTILFSSDEDSVVAFDTTLSVKSNKKPGIVIEDETDSLGTEETRETREIRETEEMQEVNEIPPLVGNPEPIYGDGLDGVRWNEPNYDKLWVRLPKTLRNVLITDNDWMKEFMNNCVAARNQNQPCTFTRPQNLMLPPEETPDGSLDFGVNIYNQAFKKLSKEEKNNYLSLYIENNGNKNYDMLGDAMDRLVSKTLDFGKGYL